MFILKTIIFLFHFIYRYYKLEIQPNSIFPCDQTIATVKMHEAQW